VAVSIPVDDQTVWATAGQIGVLFSVTERNASMHLKNALDEGEISGDSFRKSNCHISRDPQRGRPGMIWNLDAILSVGYRVRSRRGTEFRIWATAQLRERLLASRAPAPIPVDLAPLLEELRSLRAAVEALQSGPSAATGAISPTQYAAFRSDAGVLARWEHRAGLATSAAAARASIDQDLRSRTGWGGKARPWTTLPAHLLAEARTVLRERMTRSRAQVPEGEQLALPYDPAAASKVKH
jgi:hypothetical protein